MPSEPPEPKAPTPPETRRRKPVWLMFLVAFAAILVPFLFWRLTWYGTELTDEDLRAYLQETDNVRHIQHALEQLSVRVQSDRATAEPFYPLVLPLAKHKERAIRGAVAWFMGEDGRDEKFRKTLLVMLADPEPSVRHNTACALARFRDDSGREILRAMFVPHVVRARIEGTVTVIVEPKDVVGIGADLVRIDTGAEEPVKRLAPLPGRIFSVSKKKGDRVRPGEEICAIAPTADEVLQSLRALYIVGTLGDISEVQRFQSDVSYFKFSRKIADQAKATEMRIRMRAEEG